MVACPLRLLAATTTLLCVVTPKNAHGSLVHGGMASSTTIVISDPATLPFIAKPPPLTRHSRLATRDIQRFRSYKDVSVLPFHIPERVRFASFNFTVTESVMSSLVRKCPPRRVTVFLKFGSYPVVNPDGAEFPDFYEMRRLPYYYEEFDSDGEPRTINVTNPLPGEWYAVAFLSYTDPNDDKIQQQGLSASCIALLESALDISTPEDIPQLQDGIAVQVRAVGSTEEALRKHFRFFVPEGTAGINVELIVNSCSRNRCPLITTYARAHGFPGEREVEGGNETVRMTCDGEDIKTEGECVMGFIPEDDAWLYLTVEAFPDVKSVGKELQVGYSIAVSFDNRSSGMDEECNVTDGVCWNHIALTRQSYVALFMFNYIRKIDPAKSSSARDDQAVNISTDATTLLEFPVYPVKDVGGTLTLELRLDKTFALLNATSSLDVNVTSLQSLSGGPNPFYSLTNMNVSVVACLTYSSKRIPRFPDLCEDISTKEKYECSIQLNTTMRYTYTGKLHVPFPEPGRWYLSLRAFCFTSLNDSDVLTECGDLNETQVSFVIDSEMCGSERCGKWGHCNNYLSGGVIFATCVCQHGYRGWGCTDDQRIDQLKDLLMAALLLTLSNLPFLPASIVAARRGYYTEAFVYSCTLFFSTFYHACEAGEDVYSYCLMKLHVLQFCDFYSAILALWVTLIAMADLPPTPRSLMHMAGAVGIALGTEYDRTSLSVFMIPTLVGVALVGIRWGMRCRAQRSCYPHKNYWKFCVPPGAILVLVGVVCFSFLQTRSNYKYVHSAWHSMMALAIIFALPSRNHSAFESVESDDSMDSTASFWKRTKLWLCRLPGCRCL